MKANKKALGDANWWTKLTLGTSMDEQDTIDRKQLVKIADKLVKKRKRTEKKLSNTAKFAEKTNTMTINKLHKIMVKPTKKAKQDMVKYGLDLAKWWDEQHEI